VCVHVLKPSVVCQQNLYIFCKQWPSQGRVRVQLPTQLLKINLENSPATDFSSLPNNATQDLSCFLVLLFFSQRFPFSLSLSLSLSTPEKWHCEKMNSQENRASRGIFHKSSNKPILSVSLFTASREMKKKKKKKTFI
jgi:hypothetical protein